jgi:predicted ATPase
VRTIRRTGTFGDTAAGAGPTQIRTPDQRVRVFISSTLGELADERRAARAAVEQLRLTPIMFELGARPHPPRALYRSYLAQSDVFVGIYWQRYGWVAPDMDISGLEDELLLSAGMPRLVYVKRPAPEMEPRLAEVLRSLEGDGGPSYKPFTTPDELRELLLDDLALLLTERFHPERRTPSAAREPSNLPAPTSSFVGRGTELAQLDALLADTPARLVTLVGPGGTGKTRLAIEAARAAASRFADGVVFVDLAAERDPDGVLAAIARALPGSGGPGGSPLERLVQDVADREVLLVLDNLEQVIAVGSAIVEVLERCPRVRVLVTSREALRVSAEHVMPVPVLSVPAPGGAASLEDVLRSEAGQLFVDRAVAVGAGFQPLPDDAADLAAICRRLDGLPLAIELAAAQVRLLSIQELRDALDERLDVLTGGSRDRPGRQRTLRATIEWSEELLTDDERTVLHLLSLFSDARLVDVDETLRTLPDLVDLDVVGSIGGLVDKSLVRVTPGSDRRPRFSMLQTIQAYAAEQLATRPDLASPARRAHAERYRAVAVELRRDLERAERAAVLARLGDELGNLRSAWAHWAEQGDIAALDDLLGPLWGYYEARGDYRATVELGEDLLRVLAQLPETRERRHDELVLRAALARTNLAVQGFSPEAEQTVTEVLELLEGSGEARQRFPLLRGLASLHLWRSDFAKGAAAARELTAIAEAERDPALLREARLVTAISTSWVEDVPAAVEDMDQAAAHAASTTAGFVELRVGANPAVVADAIGGLLRWTAGHPDRAVQRMDLALERARDLDHPYSLAFVLHHAALLDLWRSDAASLAERTSESRALAETHDYAVWSALATILGGAGDVLIGRGAEGLDALEAGFARYLQLPTPPIFWPALLTIRAEAHGRAGDPERGVALLEEAWTDLDPDHPSAPEVAITHGALLLAVGRDRDEATGRLWWAADRSARRQARLPELQSLTHLAPIDGRARGRLRTLLATFTEGHDTAVLRAAAAMLEGGS